MTTIFQMIGASFVLIQLLMVVLWFIYYAKGRAGIVDLGWPLGFVLATLAYFIIGDGDLLRKLVLLFMVAVWAARLFYYLYRRFEVGYEDPRYEMLARRWGERKESAFLILYIFQGVLIIFLSLPFLLVSYSSGSDWSFWEPFGILLWGAGVYGTHVAEQQLQTYKTEHKGQKEAVCDVGFWRYSRHPNYFFEWVVWVGFFFFALPSTMGLLAIISPLLIYYLLRHVSGVPMLEKQLLTTKGKAYEAYQERTSEFFPWIPSKKKAVP